MSRNVLPLSVSSRLDVIERDPRSMSVTPYANNGVTGEDAPVLITLESDDTLGVETFARLLYQGIDYGNEEKSRLVINGIAEYLAEIFSDGRAHNIQTPFGTIETMINGSLADPNDPLTADNYPFVTIIPPENWRREIARIELRVPTAACPVSLKRVRDKATGRGGICGNATFYLEGVNMTYGAAGEKLELMKTVDGENVKVCDVTVTRHDSKVNFECNVPPGAGVEPGVHFLRLTTKADTDKFWPIDLKVEVIGGSEPEPIDETDDHSVKAMTFKDGESSTEFHLSGSSEWRVTGSGLFDDAHKPAGNRWKLLDVTMTAGGETVMFNCAAAADGTSLVLTKLDSLAAGTYTDAVVSVNLIDADENGDSLMLPIDTLIVE